jgi:uncharacterized protein
MGLAELSIYLDSCLAIYLVEENISFVAKLENALTANSDAKFCISPLTEMECLIMPLRGQNKLLIAKFENWFRTVEVLPMESEVFHNAAQLRADFNSLKTPDALHLATAFHYNCDEFWTNDNRLNSIAPSLVKNILIT